MIIVFNSSPLICLAKLGLLDIFVTEYPYKFYAPISVADEIQAKEDEVNQYISQLVKDKKISVIATNLSSLAKSLGDRLGLGEAEAIALGTELKADFIILDDFPARKQALKLGLNVKGTLAIINKLHQDAKAKIDSKDDL